MLLVLAHTMTRMAGKDFCIGIIQGSSLIELVNKSLGYQVSELSSLKSLGYQVSGLSSRQVSGVCFCLCCLLVADAK